MMLLGFDIGGTKCAISLGFMESSGGLTITEKIVLKTIGSAYEMIEQLFIAGETLLEKHNLEKEVITGIGISCGGPLNSKTGTILSPPNLPGWDNIPIVELTEKRFGGKTILQNDANACAVAEWKFGAGVGYNNIIFLTFGTGMGAGLILNGKLYSGTSDMAGEVGHVRLMDTGPVGYGKAGSFEGFCSGGGIAQLAREKAVEIMSAGGSVAFCQNMDDLPGITAQKVADAAIKGDETAKEIFATSGYYLGKGLSLLIDILNPEIIIIGSIYSRVPALLSPAMKKVIQTETLTLSQQCCSIVPAALGENIGDYAALALAGIV